MKVAEYRMWDTLAREMYYLKDGDDTLSFTADGWHWTHYRPGKEMSVFFCTYISGVLMEYIGIKDKNGKKIFGGEIVRHEVTRTPKPMFKVKSVIYHGASYRIGDSYSAHIDHVAPECLEVIGNIYENPELLEKPITTNERDNNDRSNNKT